MQRAAVGAKRWRALALLFSVASGLAAAQQFQPLNVSTEVPKGIAEVQANMLAAQDVSPAGAGELDRVRSGVGQPESASEAPNTDDLCARATASRADYIPIWRAEFLRRNAMTAAYFDERVAVIDTNVQCWQTGASFGVRYRVGYEWTSAELNDGFLILLYEHEPGWHHRNVPRDRLFGAAEVSRAIDWSIGSPRIESVAMLKGLRFSTRGQAIAALEQAAHGAIGETRQRYVDGRPHLDADGVISNPENRCFRGWLDLVTGAVSVREGPCRIGEPWPATVVPAGSPCDSPGHCAASPSWPRNREWRCSRETIGKELRATDWKAVTRVEVIPRDVRAAFRAKFMANPGAPWTSGCVQDGRLPGTQLVFAAHTPRLVSQRAGWRHRDDAELQLLLPGLRRRLALPCGSAPRRVAVGSPSRAGDVDRAWRGPRDQGGGHFEWAPWVLAPGQDGRGPDTDAAGLRGVVLEGERFGARKGTVVASIDVWLADPVGGACRKQAGPTFPLSEESIVGWSPEKIRVQFAPRDLEKIASQVQATVAPCETQHPWIRLQVLTADNRRTEWS